MFGYNNKCKLWGGALSQFMSKSKIATTDLLKSDNSRHGWRRERIVPSDCEFVFCEMFWLAEWVKKRYPSLNYNEIRNFLFEMLSVSI